MYLHTFKKSTGTIFFLLALVLHLPARAQKVTEYAKSDSLKVGDIYNYALTLDKSEAYDKIIFPDSSSFKPAFDLNSMQRYRLNDFKDSLVYHLQFFGTADTTIGRLPVKLIKGTDTTVVYSSPVPIYFKSVLQSKDEKLRPLKPIFDFAAAWWPYILALLVLAGAGWYLYSLYKKKSIDTEPKPKAEFIPRPFKDPLQQLAAKLQQLKSFSFSTQEDYKLFYITLGDAIRYYFEDLYHIQSMESTSGEILYELNRRSVDRELIDKTRAVLNEADMVKFAKFTPTEEQAEGALRKADAFLKRARQVDAAKIDHLRRQHQSKMEAEHLAFKKAEKEGAKVDGGDT